MNHKIFRADPRLKEFEREFEINIPDNQAESISTVGEAISFVENAVNNK